MTWLSTVLVFVFSQNALLRYALIDRRPDAKERRGKALDWLISTLTCGAAASLATAIDRYALTPVGLSNAIPLAYGMAIAPCIAIPFALARKRKMDIESFVLGPGLSPLPFGIAMIVSSRAFSVFEALAAGLAAGLGYWLASRVLAAIVERTELEDLPSAMKGKPIALVAAGLMALAFGTLDAVFFKNLLG